LFLVSNVSINAPFDTNIFQIADRKKGNIPVEVGELGVLLPLDFPEPAVVVTFGVALLTSAVLVAKLAALSEARSIELQGGRALPCADSWKELATLVSV
jgi:hypothetical protein